VLQVRVAGQHAYSAWAVALQQGEGGGETLGGKAGERWRGAHRCGLIGKGAAEAPEAERDLEVLSGTAKKAHRTKRTPKYDADEVMADLKSGMKAADVANAHNVSLPTVYRIKNQIEASRKS
jgi:hypothetical protein